jgi:hypothetical protein
MVDVVVVKKVLISALLVTVTTAVATLTKVLILGGGVLVTTTGVVEVTVRGRSVIIDVVVLDLMTLAEVLAYSVLQRSSVVVSWP